MHYSFEAYPLVYAAAALAIFGLPMTLLFIAAMRAMTFGYSQKSASPSRSHASVTQMPVVVKPAKPPRMTRKRALKVEWVSLPVERP